MIRRITPKSSLDNLKKQAKRWLKELRSGSFEARARLDRVHRAAPPHPGLRDIQHALALEYGFAGWSALKAAVEESVRAEHAGDTIARFLEYACPDHHVRGGPAHRIARHAAMRILQRHPALARHDIYTAVVSGDIIEVERRLQERPELANAKRSAAGPDRSGAGGAMDFLRDLGAKPWTPLLHLCFTRLPLAQANGNAVAIARLLLDRGADPNAYFMAGDSRYTPLVGVVGEGEEGRQPHPRRDELARLLLERGAEPYDQQVIYNIHFRGEILWYLELMHEFSLKAGRKEDWDDPEWHMLDMGAYGSGARWHLGIAVEHNDLELAEWCLTHGANSNSEPETDDRFPRRSLYERALELGHLDLAELLARHGAKRTDVKDAEGLYVAACMRLDRDEVLRLLAQHPEYRTSPKAMLAAIKRDRDDVVALLLEIGTPVEMENENKQRPLHIAASNDAVQVAELLIRRGAEIDPVEPRWNNTPIDFAVYHEHARMIDLLSGYTRDAGNLAFAGKAGRLGEVLGADPGLAKNTSLFWLPEDEAVALEIAKLLLEYGADPTLRDNDGRSAADRARRRGLHALAALLEESRKQHELAAALVAAYDGDSAAIERLRGHYAVPLTQEDVRALAWRSVYSLRQRSSQEKELHLQMGEAQELLARDAGFGNWTAFIDAAAAGRQAPGKPYQIDRKQNTIMPRRALSPAEWEMLLGVMVDQRITGIDANGQMTDTILAQITELDHVTRLHLAGSRQVTDEGVRQLARMPQLRQLDLSGTTVTDHGLEVVRHLRDLRDFHMPWQRLVTDAGLAHLASCEQLESVDLMGTDTGDGAIRALVARPNLRRLKTGRRVTDGGLAFLHQFPAFSEWRGGELKYSLMDSEAGPTQLLLDGPFTNSGVASLAGLDGLFGLSFFWHVSALTPDALAPLVRLPNLGLLGWEGELCDDTAMRHIGAMPHLRMLQAQGTVATDDGFAALSRSQTLEHLWGRDCPNLTSRGFLALSTIPALQGLGVSCKRVGDEALAAVPRFPALRELMPMDVNDDGFIHVGRCEQLETLWCMYCRDTGDAATESIRSLGRLKTYYAGKTRITDRSLEVLATMTSLERLTFWETEAVTDVGVRLLAGLPRLRELNVEGLPHVTADALTAFPPEVHVVYLP